MSKPTISPRSIQAYRLCHHSFEALSTREAAKRMGVTIRQVQRLLQQMRAKAPQLFPILTPAQYYIYACIVEQGLTHEQVANVLNCTLKNVDNHVQKIKNKGMSFDAPRKTIRYENYMDDKVITRF